MIAIKKQQGYSYISKKEKELCVSKLEQKVIAENEQKEVTLLSWMCIFEDGHKMILNLRAGKKEYFIEAFLYCEMNEISQYTKFKDIDTPIGMYTMHDDKMYTLTILEEEAA